MLQKSLSLSELLVKEKITLSEEEIKKKDVVVIPNQINGKDIIYAQAVAPVKEIMSKTGNSAIVYRNAERKIADFRGGEYELPLFILTDVALPIFVGVVSAWIYGKIEGYEKLKKEQPENSLVKMPCVKVRGYITKDSKYFEIEGTATQTIKEISEQFTQEKKK